MISGNFFIRSFASLRLEIKKYVFIRTVVCFTSDKMIRKYGELLSIALVFLAASCTVCEFICHTRAKNSPYNFNMRAILCREDVRKFEPVYQGFRGNCELFEVIGS